MGRRAGEKWATGLAGLVVGRNHQRALVTARLIMHTAGKNHNFRRCHRFASNQDFTGAQPTPRILSPTSPTGRQSFPCLAGEPPGCSMAREVTLRYSSQPQGHSQRWTDKHPRETQTALHVSG